MSEAALAAMFFYDALGDSSGVLINKLGLRDQKNLEQAEAAITSLRSIAFPPSIEVNSYDGFKAIHKHLFGEIYEWAGSERPYTTGHGPVAFAKHEFIKSWMEKQFDWIKQLPPEQLANPREFALAAAKAVNELNAGHPFIEGNGRTTRVWLQLFARAHGHEIDCTQLSRADWYDAVSKGFETGNSAPLAKLITRCMSPAASVQFRGVATELLDSQDPVARYNDAISRLAHIEQANGLSFERARNLARAALERQSPALVKARDEAVIQRKVKTAAD
jgi:cell filamentation protein